MTFFEKVFGSKLLTPAGLKATEEVLASKKHVLCYFSAHWCPPCRRFTPELSRVYTATAVEKGYEIVFVSLDRDHKAFDEYYGTMPWAAIPYEGEFRTQAAKKYGGSGIPELVVFTSSGEVVTRDGVQNVMEDSALTGFPWSPATFADALGKTLINKRGSAVSTDTLEGKTIGVYCSAHWCPPCRQFTPVLAKFYAEYKKRDPNFEIVFCSSDKDKDTMMSYFAESHGDYLCYDFDSPSRSVMRKLVNADGIPTFAIYSADGKLINKAGRNKVTEGVDAVISSGWEPPLVGDLGTGSIDCQGTDLQETPSIVVFCPGSDDDEQTSVFKALEAFARSHKSDEPAEILAYISKTTDGVAGKVLSLAKQHGSPRVRSPDSDPLLLLFDLSNGTFAESPATDITPEAIEAFYTDVQNGKVESKPLAQ